MTNLEELRAAVFFAICEKPEGADNPPPPAVHGLNAIFGITTANNSLSTKFMHERGAVLQLDKYLCFHEKSIINYLIHPL